MSGNKPLTMFAAILMTAAIHLVIDPIVTGLIGNVDCTGKIAECATSLSYVSLFWDRFLYFVIFLIIVWYIVASIREATPGGRFYE
jgi:hypothetical protein|tara:strand:+ start:284 stop:541 length:258 start_codon:yes stop_codon:yes gene_type:complete